MLCRFNSRKTEYKEPFGAVKKDTEVRYYLEIESSVYPRDVTLLVRRDGEEIKPIRTEYIGMNMGFSSFRAVFTPEKEGLYFYSFSFNSNFGQKKILRSKFGEGEVSSSGAEFQLTVYGDFSETDRFLGNVFYQIFPDRFASSGRELPKMEGRIVVTDRDKVPAFLPDEKGIVRNNEFYGGDFEGIRCKIPYLKSLGVDTVYLNPIFEAQSNHRYDTADYLKPDPFLGDEGDFRRLVDSLHEAGIKIILDGVFSHTGADSIYFNKYGKYDSLGAYQSKNSPYYNWYNFTKWPDEYRSWWGINILPEVSEDNPEFLNFICGEGGVIHHWMSQGIDGFRLDVADELPDSFLREVYSAVKRYNRRAIVIGEVWEDASNKISYSARRRFLMGDEMDSVMNYPFRSAIIGLLKYGDRDYFKETVETVLENYPDYTVKNLMNFLSTHDTKRILTALGGEDETGRDKVWASEKRMSNEELEKGADMVKSAFTLLYLLPGNPQIYYGDEVGMQGYSDPFNRMYYSDKNDLWNIKEHVISLGKIRARFKELLSGTNTGISTLHDGLVTVIRKGDNENLVCVVNVSKEEKRIGFIAENCGFEELLTFGYDSENALLKPMCAAVFNF